MPELIDQFYYLIDESLPIQHYPDPAAQALFATFTPEQNKLFDAYYQENMDREDQERLRLFRFLVKLGLHVP